MPQELKYFRDQLRSLGLRPTKQRLAVCKILFNRKETFHFTIEQLEKILQKSSKEKISLATLYNTVHALKKRGHLKEISLKENKTFFDTNTQNHHHFYDEDSSQLIDIEKNSVSLNKTPNAPKGKKVKGVEVLIRIANNNQNQKK
tara:strand:- start:2584 stop:3018 length:435 start_codon:yes stop_codon:yes gene_type:complete